MPLLLNAFLTTPPEQRAQLEQSISAYACIADPATLATFFRAAITKLIKVPTASSSPLLKKIGDAMLLLHQIAHSGIDLAFPCRCCR